MADKFAIDGAIIKCSLCTKPQGKLVVTSNEMFLQDKFWATEGDKGKQNLVFEGNCTKWSKNPPPCQSVISPASWQKTADGVYLDGNKALLESSTITCNTGGVPISIEETTQTAVPTDLPIAPPVDVDKTVYLTFDDGVQPGTEEVLEVLKSAGVKATFFLTGVNIVNFAIYYGRDKADRILDEIKSDHEVANHSYSHANDYYSQYYVHGGLKIGQNEDQTFQRRTVLEDFQKNDEIILGPGQQLKLARFPGRNTWKYPGIEEIDDDNDYDTRDEATQLHQNGYVIYGWDTEWKMSFDASSIARSRVQERADAGTLDWSDEEHTHPFIDFNSEEHKNIDKLSESPSSVFDKIDDVASHWWFEFDNSKKEDKVILLMHDRAFRDGEAEKLTTLINLLKADGYAFDVISNY